MTADELLPKIAAGHWTLWYRKRCRPDHWHIFSYGQFQDLINEKDRMLNRHPGRCALILEPGETPLSWHVPHDYEHGGEG